MISALKIPPALRGKWQQLPERDRRMLSVLAAFLLGVLLFSGLWQPAKQRLAVAERLYQQRLELAREMQRALPGSSRELTLTPLSTRLNDSAMAAGLDLQQLEVDEKILRITLRGEASRVLLWLENIEREGALFQSLSLEKNDELLEARLVLNGV